VHRAEATEITVPKVAVTVHRAEAMIATDPEDVPTVRRAEAMAPPLALAMAHPLVRRST
jgi:hypothetical protein